MILRETDDVAADTAPEEREAGGLPLIFLPDEGTPHLERGIHAAEEVALEFEERRSVEPMLALQRQDAVGRTEAIASDDRRGFVIPEYYLVIPCVESIEVAIQPSALRDRAEGRLTQATDLAQGVR